MPPNRIEDLSDYVAQKDRNRQLAINGAVERIEAAQAIFKLEIELINLHFTAHNISQWVQIAPVKE